MFSCFKGPSGDDMPRSKYMRSSSGGHPTSERSEWPSQRARTASEPPAPRERKKFGTLRSAMAAAAGSSKIKLLDTFQRKRQHQAGTRYISMKVPSDTRLPPHVPKSLGTTDNNAPVSNNGEELFQVPSSWGTNRELLSSTRGMESDSATPPQHSTPPLHPAAEALQPSSTCSIASAPATMSSPSLPCSAPQSTAQYGTTIPVPRAGTLQSANSLSQAVQPGRLKSCFSTTSSPPNASLKPSNPYYHAPPTTLKNRSNSCNSFISIPLDALSQPCISAQIGDTAHSNSKDQTASQDMFSHPTAAVMSAATSSSLAFRDSQALMTRSNGLVPSGSAQMDSSMGQQGTIWRMPAPANGAATLDLCSDSLICAAAMPEAGAEPQPDICNVATANTVSQSTSKIPCASSQPLSALGEGSSMYLAPGFAQMAACEVGHTLQEHPTVPNTVHNDRSTRLPAQFSAVVASVEGNSMPAQPNEPRVLPEPFTPRHTPRTGDAVSTQANAPSTPEFATPMDPSQFPSPQSHLQAEFSTPQAAVSPERIAVLPRSLVHSIVMVHDTQVPSATQQLAGDKCHGETRPAYVSFDHLSSSLVPQIIGEGGFRPSADHACSQAFNSAASLGPMAPQPPPESGAPFCPSAACTNAALQKTPGTVGTESTAGLTPPQSLNLELSTPESRPMLTPDHRHTFTTDTTTHAGCMGCVDNPVFSQDKSMQSEGTSACQALTVSAVRTQPGVYGEQATSRSNAQPVSHPECQRPSKKGGGCGSTEGRDNSAGIAAAAKRLVAMLNRDEPGSPSANKQGAEQGTVTNIRRKRQQRQMPKDEAAELLFSSTEADDTYSVHDDSESVHSQEDEIEDWPIRGVHDVGASEACTTDVPSPPMPHTLSTKGTSAKPQAVRPLHRLPELSLQPSTAKTSSTEAFKTANQPAGAARDNLGRELDRSRTFSTNADHSNALKARDATDASITVGPLDSARNASQSSEGRPGSHGDGRSSSGRAGLKARSDASHSKTSSSRGHTQTSSRGQPCSSADTFATVGSRVLAYEESNSGMGGANTLTSGSSVSGSGALRMCKQNRLHGYSNTNPWLANRSNETLGEVRCYVPPDLAFSDRHTQGTTNSRVGDPSNESERSSPPAVPPRSNGACIATGFDHSMSVFTKPSSSAGSPASKGPAEQQPDNCARAGAASSVADCSQDDHLGILHNPASVLAAVNESGCPDDTTADGCIHATHVTTKSSQSGNSLTSNESQYLDAVMNTTVSGLELDFSSSNLGVLSPARARTFDPHKRSKDYAASLNLSPQGSVLQALHDATGPIRRHTYHAAAMAHAMAAQSAADDDGTVAEATHQSGPVTSAGETYAASVTFAPSGILEESEGGMFQGRPRIPSPSPSHSPLPTCPSLPLIVPDAHPKVGQVLGGRFLLRRVVGASSRAIIYSANDLQEGSVPCSVRVPAPKAPLAASMIALGRMQWLRGQVSHAEGAISLVRILSMPNLLGHGIVVATESLEASARGRLDSISCGKAKPFSNSDLRSLACQLLKGLKFMHESGIVHGDINLDSLFFKSEEGSQIRFIDLGCGCFPTSDTKPAGHSYGRTPKRAHCLIGGNLSHRREMGGLETPPEQDSEDSSSMCRAPEAFATPPIVTDKMDVWSVGCILYQMETGEPLGNEPQMDEFSPHGILTSQYFSDTNSAWGDETYQQSDRSHLPRSLGLSASGVHTRVSADVSEELLYDSLPGGARVRRSISPFRQSVNTQDGSQVMRASRGSRFDADAQLASAGVTNVCSAASPAARSAAALACAEMWDVDALVIVEDEMANVTTTDPGFVDSNFAGLSAAAQRDDDRPRLTASAEIRSKPLHTSSEEEERLMQMRACAQVLQDALEADHRVPALSASCSDIWANENMASTWDESLSTRNKQPVHPHSTHSAVLPSLAQRRTMGRATHGAPNPAVNSSVHGSAWGGRRQNAGRSQLDKESDVRDVIRSEFKSIGNLQPPVGVTCSAPTSSNDVQESSVPRRRTSLLNVWQNTPWGSSRRASVTSRKASLSPTTTHSAFNPDQPSRSTSPTPTEKNRFSRIVRRGSRSRFGIRSLSSVRNPSAGNDTSAPLALQSFRSDNFAAETSDSFSNVFRDFENTIDTQLTVSARESYHSLPSTHAHTQKGSLQPQSGRVPGTSCPLSGPLTGPVLSARGPGTPCRPWLAQRLSKIQDRDFARFLACLLENSFMSRPTADQALQHSWLSYATTS